MKFSARVVMLVVLAVSALPERADARPGVRHHGHHGHHGHQIPLDQQIVQLCGAKLAESLQDLCKGRGYNDLESTYGAASTTVIHSSHRSRGGLASECCHVGCSLADLDKYCQPAGPSSSSSESNAEDERRINEAHQENHIRPIAEETNEDSQESHGQPTAAALRTANGVNTESENDMPKMPTVTGGRPNTKFNITQLQILHAAPNMVKVGTIDLPHRTPVTVAIHRRQKASV